MKIQVFNVIRQSIIVTLVAFLVTACETNIGGFALEKSLPNGFKGYGYQIVSREDGHPVRSGDSSLRFEVRSGDCGKSKGGGWDDCAKDRERHEIKSSNVGLSGEKWYHWSIFLPSDFVNVSPVKLALGQFHQEGSYPVFMFQNASGGLHADNQIIGTTLEHRKILTEEEMVGRWSDILIHVNWKSDDQGFFHVYVNGESTPRYSWVGPTHEPGVRVFYKVGVYRSFISRFGGVPVPTQIVYYDDIVQATSCEKATRYFDCAQISNSQDKLPKLEDMANTVCLGSDCYQKTFRRNLVDLETRFECWLAYAKAQTVDDLPSNSTVRVFSRRISENASNLLPRDIIAFGMPKKVMKVHRSDISRLVNWTSSNEAFCERPSRRIPKS